MKDLKRQAKIERRKAEREAHESASARTRFWSKVSWFTGGPLLIVALFLAWNSGWFGPPADDHPYADFAKCLTEADLTMYGTDWCPYCQNQKQMFDDAFEFIDYVNCDFNKNLCQIKGVKGYPTWHFQGQLWAEGVQTFPDFADISGCTLPEGVEATGDGGVTVVEE